LFGPAPAAHGGDPRQPTARDQENVGAESDFLDRKPAAAARPRRGPGREPSTGVEPAELHAEADGVPHGAVAGLQRLAGNRAVAELLGGTGSPIEHSQRAGWEASFGRDFSDVRIHSGPEASELTRSAGAVALTIGDDIVVDDQVPGFESRVGRNVLGEELAHVAQGVGTGPVSGFTEPHGSIEHAAERAGAHAAAGRRADVAPQAAAASAAGRRLVLFPYPHIEDDDASGSDEEGVATRQRRPLTQGQKNRLLIGALTPVKRTLPLIGTKDPAELAASLAGIFELVGGISSPDAELNERIRDASNYVSAGRNGLMTAANPAGALKFAGSELAGVVATLDGLIAAGTAAPGTAAPAAPGPAAAPGAGAAPASGGAAVPSAGEVEQVKGLKAGVQFVQSELVKPEPDFSLAYDRLGELSVTAQSYGDSPALGGPLGRAGRQLDGVRDLVLGIQGGRDAALDIARGRLSQAVAVLAGLAGVEADGDGGVGTDETGGP
jgi:uncharacterized protein DUF4157